MWNIDDRVTLSDFWLRALDVSSREAEARKQRAQGNSDKPECDACDPENCTCPPNDEPENSNGEEAPRLTRMERIVLLELAKGGRSVDIADALFVSKRTIDFHLGHIYWKLKVSNRVCCIREALRIGYIRYSDICDEGLAA